MGGEHLCSQYGNIVLDHELGSLYNDIMRVIAKSTLQAFWRRQPDAEGSLLAWYREVEKEDWDCPTKVKARYGNASIVRNNRVVFNIKGTSYRLVVRVNYKYRLVYVRFVGTHVEYDKINVEEV
jgi:mRNA interferase HigB